MKKRTIVAICLAAVGLVVGTYVGGTAVSHLIYEEVFIAVCSAIRRNPRISLEILNSLAADAAKEAAKKYIFYPLGSGVVGAAIGGLSGMVLHWTSSTVARVMRRNTTPDADTDLAAPFPATA